MNIEKEEFKYRKYRIKKNKTKNVESKLKQKTRRHIFIKEKKQNNASII